MASLNLSGLKLNKNSALSVEEFQSLQEVKNENKQGQISIKEELKQEEKPVTSFAYSLSSLISGEPAPTEVPVINPVIDSVQTTNLVESTPINISLPGIESSVIQESDITTPIGVNISTDIIELNEEPAEGLAAIQSSLQQEPKEEISTPVIEEKKEFFKNFNVIDVFAEEKKHHIKEEPKVEKMPDPVEEKIEEAAEVMELNTIEVSENEPEIITLGGSNEVKLIKETPLISTEDIENPITLDVAEVMELNTIEVSENEPEIITLGGSNEVKLIKETPVVNLEGITNKNNTLTNSLVSASVDELKKDLSAERKPGGIGIFKRKSFIFSILGVFVLAGAIFGLAGGGEENGKADIKEKQKPVIQEKQKPVIQENNYQEGIDYSIQKNQKKNIKKVKVITPDNSDLEIQNSTLENSTGNIISPNEQNTDSSNPLSSEDLNKIDSGNENSNQDGISIQ